MVHKSNFHLGSIVIAILVGFNANVTYFCQNKQVMHQKYRSFDSDTNFIEASSDDISDALYHAIKSHNFPYNKSVMDRVTPVRYSEGEVVMDLYLDYGTSDQIHLVRASFLYAVDEDICVQPLTVDFIRGKNPVPMIATAW